MNKEEIFSKYFHPVTDEDRRLKRSIFDFADEVADQQTEQLKKEVEKLNESFAVVNGIANTLQFEIESNKDFYESQLSEKENALEASERLNEKHVGYIEKLEAELNEYKEKAILWDNLKTGDKLNSLVGGDSKFCEKVDNDKIKRLESELSELKAKHKEHLQKAFTAGCRFQEGEQKSWETYNELTGHQKPNKEMNFEQYYTQTHG